MKFPKLSTTKQVSFENLKHKLHISPISSLPHLGAPYTLDTDACENQVGYVLIQEKPEDGTLKPISCCPRTLNPTEHNKQTNHRKLFSISSIVLLQLPYLEETHFNIRTDHD